MSLFGDDRFQWRETYFVLFRQNDRPSASDAAHAIGDDPRLELARTGADEDGRLESMTLLSPDDFSAMDITYVVGEEVEEQKVELLKEMAKATLDEEDRTRLDFIADCDARFDIFHFEQVHFDDESTEEFLDPGGLLIVIERLAKLCHGVGVDPQSGSFLP